MKINEAYAEHCRTRQNKYFANNELAVRCRFIRTPVCHLWQLQHPTALVECIFDASAKAKGCQRYIHGSTGQNQRFQTMNFTNARGRTSHQSILTNIWQVLCHCTQLFSSSSSPVGDVMTGSWSYRSESPSSVLVDPTFVPSIAISSPNSIPSQESTIPIRSQLLWSLRLPFEQAKFPRPLRAKGATLAPELQNNVSFHHTEKNRRNP